MDYKEIAPLMGLDLKSPLSAVKPGYCLVANNLICGSQKIHNRKGYEIYADMGIPDPIRTIIAAPEWNQKLYCGGGQIFNQSAEAVLSGSQSDYYVHAYFSHLLFLCNGLDDIRQFDGSEIKATGFTNSESENQNYAWCGVLNNEFVCGFDNSIDFYAPGVGKVAGALNPFYLSQYAKMGGKIMAAASWGRDAADGFHDYSAFITDQGEIIVYEGAGFGDSGGSVKYVGTYITARPIGRKCWLRWEGDIIWITENGFIPMSQIAANGELAKSKFSDLIDELIVNSKGKSNDGWQGLAVPGEEFVLFNIPDDQGDYAQLCMSIHNGAWTTWSGIKSHCWAVSDGMLLFGTDNGQVMQYKGQRDNGDYIEASLQTRFIDMDVPANKSFKLFAARIESTGKINLSWGISHDYRDIEVKYQDSDGNPGFVASITDDPDPDPYEPVDRDSHWDKPLIWGTESIKSLYSWHSISGFGQALSVKMNFRTQWMDYNIYDFLFKYDQARGKI